MGQTFPSVLQCKQHANMANTARRSSLAARRPSLTAIAVMVIIGVLWWTDGVDARSNKPMKRHMDYSQSLFGVHCNCLCGATEANVTVNRRRRSLPERMPVERRDAADSAPETPEERKLIDKIVQLITKENQVAQKRKMKEERKNVQDEEEKRTLEEKKKRREFSPKLKRKAEYLQKRNEQKNDKKRSEKIRQKRTEAMKMKRMLMKREKEEKKELKDEESKEESRKKRRQEKEQI